MASKTVSTRLDPEELELLDVLGDLSGLDRASLIKVLLRRGMQELRLEQAVAAYRKERVTLSRAAELSGLSLWDFLARMDEEGLHYDVAEFEADLAALSSAP
jgi:predicted HTH domain antitoxin